ncbi:hypothetical protein AMECASPLE_010120 [Ameca splendens]|uniref:Uncharacterized protein n=1 Tax=Ameca splendens TaxID=208324 RepID=A0ABV0YN80_9TELE
MAPSHAKLPSGSAPQPAVTNSPTSSLTAMQHPFTPPPSTSEMTLHVLPQPAIQLLAINTNPAHSSCREKTRGSSPVQQACKMVNKKPRSASPRVFLKAVWL